MQSKRPAEVHRASAVFMALWDNLGLPDPMWSCTLLAHGQESRFHKMVPALNMLPVVRPHVLIWGPETLGPTYVSAGLSGL